MNFSKLLNKNHHLVLLVSIIFNRLLIASSQTVSEKNPFLISAAEELKQELENPIKLKIYFSGNLAGSRESCGCALNPKGGIERRYNFLKKTGLLEKKRPDNTLVLDFGNLLFKNESIPASENKNALNNAQKMLQATNFFQYDAINFGTLDRSLSQKDLQKFFGNSLFPWLSSNIFPTSRFGATFKRSINKKLQNFEVLLVGLSSVREESTEWRFETPQSILLKETKDASPSTLVVVLSDLEVGELTKIASTMNRPTIFLGSREMGGWDRPVEVGSSLLTHLRHQGQEWGVLNVSSKWQNKQGWYSPQETDKLAKRWDDLINESLKIKELEDSPEKKVEIKNLESKAVELKALAPSSKKDISFSFETIEMNASFSGKNLVSKFMN
jgi:hypothetical protein